MCGKVKSLDLIRHYIILHLLQYLVNVIKHKKPRTYLERGFNYLQNIQ